MLRRARYSYGVSSARLSISEGTAVGLTVAVPPPFRPSDPALCGSCPLVTPYYCRLGDLLYIICVVSFVLIIVHVYVCVKLFTFFDLYFVYFLQYSDTVGWVFWPVKTVGRITFIVLAQTLNHAQSINTDGPDNGPVSLTLSVARWHVVFSSDPVKRL